MELKATKHIGLMAVVNETTEKAEAIKVDTLRMMSFVINYGVKNMMVAFAWGGYDSQGHFHMDPNRPASHRSITYDVEDGEREIWNACACDAKGNPMTEFGEPFFKKLLFDHKKIDDVINGGWRLEEVEVTHKGVTVFKKEKPKKAN